GGIDLAEKVVKQSHSANRNFKRIYDLEDSLETKVRKVAQNVYGAKDVDFSSKAQQQLAYYKERGWDNLPVCMAKTQYSLSDDPTKVGRPEGFTLTIRELSASIG